MYLYEKYTHQGIKRIKHLIQCFSNHFICLFLMICLLCVNYFGGLKKLKLLFFRFSLSLLKIKYETTVKQVNKTWSCGGPGCSCDRRTQDEGRRGKVRIERSHKKLLHSANNSFCLSLCLPLTISRLGNITLFAPLHPKLCHVLGIFCC